MLRTTRILLASAVVTSSSFVPAATAAGRHRNGAGGSAGRVESALRIQAQELAGEIQSEGVQLDQLSEAYDAAHLRSQQLESKLQVLRTQMTKTDRQVTVARADLKEQALLAYLAGGAPLITELPGQPGSDPSLTVSYAQIVSGGQRRAVDAYRAVLASQTSQSKQLTAADRQVVATLAVLRTDRAAASQAMAARQQTLDQVQGQLATLVAQFQAQQQQAEQASLAQQDQLPAGTAGTAGATAGPAATPTTARSPSPPATTPRPAQPATTPSSKAPVIRVTPPSPPRPTAPPTTSARTVAPTRPTTPRPPPTTPHYQATTPAAPATPPSGNSPGARGGSGGQLRLRPAGQALPVGRSRTELLRLLRAHHDGLADGRRLPPHLAQAQYDLSKKSRWPTPCRVI